MSFEWSENLATGIVDIDNQHKEIFKQLNVLLDAMDKGKGKEEVGQVLAFLEKYIATHFRDEERYMREREYDGLSLQRAEHSQFIKDFYRLKSVLLKSGDTLDVVVKVEQALGNWLMNHIKIEDKKMAVALKECCYR